MPKISFDPLDAASRAAALAQVNAYKDSIPVKEKSLRETVAQQLTEIVEVGFNGAAEEDIILGDVTVENVKVSRIPDDGSTSGVKANGEKAVFQEFGAGVYHNGPVGGSPNPLGPKNAFYIGKFGYGMGARKVWGFYDPPGSKNLVLTHGTPASMPMYHAEQEIIPKIPEIARKVFKEGDTS